MKAVLESRTLNPTLWRTCRMLAGATRVKLLRQLHEQPGRNLSELAKAVQIGISAASQELRRIQSRGLLKVERRRSFAFYRFGADPQVPTAEPLLKALQSALRNYPEERDQEIIQIAKGFSHPRRIAILKELGKAPKRRLVLRGIANLPQSSASRHVGVLVQSALVSCENGWLVLKRSRHPLACALLHLTVD